ncbi:LrgB family protein [Alkalimarinus alittae]|uniref:LrgB family protein n=1 Tax=Alkalimarinus alittae TaxID=2961619 RepID=A0ABY6MZC2_9ALTE|nr:LrgB family protein [Alkalimarinus alittae]UZE95174.1 LrgB family protein [Alkalimarinus alittae]
MIDISAFNYVAFMASPLFCIPLTLVAYLVGTKVYDISGKNIFLQPIVTGIVLVMLAIMLLDLPYEQYFSGAQIIHFLLSTATVALAIPLYLNIKHIKASLRPLILTLLMSGIIASATAVAIAGLLGASLEIMLSLAPKSITTPFAMGVAESIGGYPPLTAGFVIFTGIVIAVAASPIFKWLNINDPIIQGSALGMIGHGIGTARALELSNKTGAFSALSMGLMGVYTSIFLPYAVKLFI